MSTFLIAQVVSSVTGFESASTDRLIAQILSRRVLYSLCCKSFKNENNVEFLGDALRTALCAKFWVGNNRWILEVMGSCFGQESLLFSNQILAIFTHLTNVCFLMRICFKRETVKVQRQLPSLPRGKSCVSSSKNFVFWTFSFKNCCIHSDRMCCLRRNQVIWTSLAVSELLSEAVFPKRSDKAAPPNPMHHSSLNCNTLNKYSVHIQYMCGIHFSWTTLTYCASIQNILIVHKQQTSQM